LLPAGEVDFQLGEECLGSFGRMKGAGVFGQYPHAHQGFGEVYRDDAGEVVIAGAGEAQAVTATLVAEASHWPRIDRIDEAFDLLGNLGVGQAVVAVSALTGNGHKPARYQPG
jgi:hypothetical protein